MSNENVMPFRRESKGTPPPPEEQAVKVSFSDTTKQENFFENFFGIINVGVDPSGTFLVLSKARATTFLKLSDVERVEIEPQKVVA